MKLTRADVAFKYTGDLEGSSVMQYLMLYRDDGTAKVIGLERVTGRLGGKSGSLCYRITRATTRTVLPRATSRSSAARRLASWQACMAAAPRSRTTRARRVSQ